MSQHASRQPVEDPHDTAARRTTSHTSGQDITGQDGPPGDTAVSDVSISLLAANLYTLLLFPVIALLAAPFALLWGWQQVSDGFAFVTDTLWLIPALVLGIVVHELLHGVGYVYCAGQSWQAVRFGIEWKCLTPYAHCREPLPIKGYRWSIALPGLVLGVLPVLIAAGTGSSWLLVWGLIFSWVAGGDLMIFWMVRRVEPECWVKDHPDRAGCYVLRPVSNTEKASRT